MVAFEYMRGNSRPPEGPDGLDGLAVIKANLLLGLASILIAYDVHPATGPTYDNLVQAIQLMGAWWHHLETVWIVRSEKTPEEIRDLLKVCVGADDQLLVLDISGDSWLGRCQRCWQQMARG